MLTSQPGAAFLQAGLFIPPQLFHHRIDVTHRMKDVEHHGCSHQFQGVRHPGRTVPQTYQHVMSAKPRFAQQPCTGRLELSNGPDIRMNDTLLWGQFWVDHQGLDLDARTMTVFRSTQDNTAVQLGDHHPSRRGRLHHRQRFKRAFLKLFVSGCLSTVAEGA